MKAISGILLALVLLALPMRVNAQAEGDKFDGYQFIRVGTVTFVLLDTTVQAMILDRTATTADSALTLKNGVIVRSKFQTVFLDSLLKQLVDTAKYARYVRNGAILTRNAFSPAAWDSLRNGQWIYQSTYALTSGSAVTATSAGYADVAGVSDVTNQDSIDFAFRSNYAGYADLAGHSLDTLFMYELDSALWAQIVDSLEVFAAGIDSVAHAIQSDCTKATQANAIGQITDFTSTMRGTVIPTTDEKAGLTERAFNSTPSAANYFMTKYAFLRQAVQYGDTTLAKVRLTMLVGVAESNQKNLCLFDTAGQNHATRIVYTEEDEQQSVFLDSVAIMGNVVTYVGQNYVKMGTGNTPGTIYIAASDPGGTRSDLWADTSNNLWKVKKGAGWTTLGGGAGGGGDSTLYLMLHRYGTPIEMDADSVLLRSRRDTTFQPLVLTGNAALLAGDASTDIGTQAGPMQNVHSQHVKVDSLGGGNSGGPDDSIHIGSDLLFQAVCRIGNPSWTKDPYRIYANAISLDTTVGTNLWAKGIGYWGQLLPYSTSTQRKIGNRATDTDVSWSWNILHSKKIMGTDSLYIWNPATGYSGQANSMLFVPGTIGLKINGSPISLTNDNLTVTTGNIVVNSADNYFRAGNSYLSTLGLHLANDSAIFAPYGGSRRYTLSQNQRRAADSACNPSATNAFITKSAMREGMLGAMGSIRIDSLRANWFQLYNYVLNHLPNSCWDSSYVPDITKIVIGSRYSPSEKYPGMRRYDPSLHKTIIEVVVDTGDTSGNNDPPGLFMYTPPSTRNEYVVNQSYNDTLGALTGCFGTIQAALDSIPNYQIKIKTGLIGSDTLRFQPHTANYSAVFRLGSVAKDTLTSIPDHITEIGVWISVGTLGTAAKSVWTSVLDWVNDSTCIIADTQVTRAAVSDCTCFIAKPWTVTIDPAITGNCWVGDSIKINAYAPLTIRGRGENQTILASGVARPKAGQSNVVFYAGVDEQNYLGLPITISDMSIYSFPSNGSTEDRSAITFYGGSRLTLRNLKGVYKVNGTLETDYTSFLQYRGASTEAAGDEDMIAIDHVVIAADSDCAVYSVAARGEFQSRNSIYSISGSSGTVLRVIDDLQTSPQFLRDEMYMSPTQTAGNFFVSAGGGYPISQTDSVTVTYCRAMGRGPGGVFLPDAGWHSAFKSASSNIDQVVNAAITKPPVEIRDALFMLSTGGVAKK